MSLLAAAPLSVATAAALQGAASLAPLLFPPQRP